MTDEVKLVEKDISELGIRHKSVNGLFSLENWVKWDKSYYRSPCSSFFLDTGFPNDQIGVYSNNNTVNEILNFNDRVNKFDVVITNLIKVNPFLDTTLYQLLYI